MRTKTKKTKQITQIVVSMLLVLTMVFMPMKMILAADAQSSSTPTQFVLVLDCSGSMEESDVNGLSPKAAKMFVDMMPVENAQIAIVAFGANWGEDSYVYPGDTTSNTYTKVTIVEGNLVLKEHEAAKWLDKEHLYSVDWLPADIGLIGKIEKDM